MLTWVFAHLPFTMPGYFGRRRGIALHDHDCLMIPGPVELEPDILAILQEPLWPHYGDAWVRLYNDTTAFTKRIFQTKHDLFLMPGTACDGQACLASSVESNAAPEHMEFDATAGEIYTLMVDGYGGGASEFTLAIDCEGSLPQDDDTGDSDSDSGRPQHSPRAQAEASSPGSDCGCASTPPQAWAGWLVLVMLRRARPCRISTIR